jgi:hypothetical protein
MVDPNLSLTPRMLAIAAIVFFAPVVVTFAVAPGIWWADYPGILFHLSLFLLVSKLEAPEWAKMAGCSWLTLDVLTGAMTLNNVPHAIADYVRLGGHIFAGMWIVGVSLRGSRPVRIVGLVTGSWMSLYTFVSPFVPRTALAPASILVLVWLGLIAWQNGGKSQEAARSA